MAGKEIIVIVKNGLSPKSLREEVEKLSADADEILARIENIKAVRR